jgi:murein L,D-transpeptidase YcbB/YkuD
MGHCPATAPWIAVALPVPDGGRTRTVPVRRRVPLLLQPYHTAGAGDDGRSEVRLDLCGRDTPIVRALAAPFRFAPVARH